MDRWPNQKAHPFNSGVGYWDSAVGRGDRADRQQWVDHGPYLHLFGGAHDEVLGFLSDLGKLLLMFYAGLEIDLNRFKSTKYRSLTFATLSFAFPLLGGAAVALVFG